MKKTLALSIVLLATLSCSKEIIESTPANEEHPLVPMTFTAKINDTNTKAYFEGVKSYWEKGDKISVSKCITSTGYTDAPVMTATTAGATTTFTGEVPAGLTRYFAAYPASTISKWKRESGTLETAYGSIKGTQVVQKISTTGGVDNYIDPDVMYLCGTATPSETDTNFTFKHPLAYIKFTVPEGMTTKVKRVTVSTGAVDADGLTTDKSIAGGFSMQWKDNSYWLIGIQGTGKTIKLQNASSSPKNLEPGNYYIAIYPRAVKYVSFEFYNYTDKTIKVFKQKGDGKSDIALKGGTVYDIGTLPVDLMVI